MPNLPNERSRPFSRTPCPRVRTVGITLDASSISANGSTADNPDGSINSDGVYNNSRASRPSMMSPPPLTFSEPGMGSSLAVNASSATFGKRTMTLLERRNKEKNGMSISCFSMLSMETIQENGRDVEPAKDAPAEAVARGWSSVVPESTCASAKRATAVARGANGVAISPVVCPDAIDVDGAIKISSYNILAARLVTTDRYPSCPTMALGEDYRIALMKKEMSTIAPDIAIFAEMSVHVHESAESLGGYMRSELGFASEHAVITDQCGIPRCMSSLPSQYQDEQQQQLASPGRRLSNTSRDTLMTSGSRSSPASPENINTWPKGNVREQVNRRTEMEGVAVFYKSQRFRLIEKVMVPFNKLAAEDTKLTAYERKKLQSSSHNVALICVLEERNDPSRIYIVAAVHLIWQRVEAQLWQSHHLMRNIAALRSKYNGDGLSTTPPSAMVTPLSTDQSSFMPTSPPNKRYVTTVIAGDFNMERRSPAFKFLCEGYVPSGSTTVGHWRKSVTGSAAALCEDTTGCCGSSLSPSLSPSPIYRRETHSACEGPTLIPLLPSAAKEHAGAANAAADDMPLIQFNDVDDDADDWAAPPAPRAKKKKGSAANHTSQDTEELLSHDVSVTSVLSNGLDDDLMGNPNNRLFPGMLDARMMSCRTGRSSSVTSLATSTTSSQAAPQALTRKNTIGPRQQPERQGFGESVAQDLLALMEDLSGSEDSPGRRRRTSIPEIHHDIHMLDCYAAYCARHPGRVSAMNPSTNAEGKVLDHILVEDSHVNCTAVLRLGERYDLPNLQVPSDHYPVGVIIAPKTLGGKQRQ